MRFVTLVVVCLVGLSFARTDAVAGAPPPWTLPRDREIYLMEDDLVYARFLTLARGGTYRQFNRDERGSMEVDRGRWEQDAAGILRLRSTCHALRPRALSAGPLSVTLAGEHAFDGLPLLLASLRQFLAVYQDAVFGAQAMSEVNRAGAPTIQPGRETVTVDRRDAVSLAARIDAALEGERSATYLLTPVKNAPSVLFALQGGVFDGTDLAAVRRAYHIADAAIPPFFFARVEAKTYAAAVGRWQGLHLPGGRQ